MPWIPQLVRIQVGDDGQIHVDPDSGPYRVMRFEVRDPPRYGATMTRDTARLLGRFGR